MLDDGAKGIVFDVRNNPGGLVDITLQCLDLVLPYGNYASATYGNGETKVIDYLDLIRLKMIRSWIFQQLYLLMEKLQVQENFADR